jgi:hypothetical protein
MGLSWAAHGFWRRKVGFHRAVAGLGMTVPSADSRRARRKQRIDDIHGASSELSLLEMLNTSDNKHNAGDP